MGAFQTGWWLHETQASVEALKRGNSHNIYGELVRKQSHKEQ
jgi:hypothetical protein